MKRTAIRRTSWTQETPSPLIALVGGSQFRGSTGCRAIVTTELYGLRHLSVSAEGRYPTWDELASAKDKFIGEDARAAMMFPPRSEYVNLHQTTLHIWELSDED